MAACLKFWVYKFHCFGEISTSKYEFQEIFYSVNYRFKASSLFCYIYAKDTIFFKLVF